jgi:flagellum-specific ATP synthase
MQMAQADFTQPFGIVKALRSEWILATGPSARVGAFCNIENPRAAGGAQLVAEVVSVDAGGLRMVPLGPADSLIRGAKVTLAGNGPPVPDLSDVANRAIDALGRKIDAGVPVPIRPRRPHGARRLTPLDRVSPSRRLHTGIRAIDGLLPLAQGQKIGIFAPSGAGKSSLLEQICAQAECDHLIFCLVGERGREVEQAWRLLASGGNTRLSTLVAAAADESPSMRVRAFELAISLAEQGRHEGKHVLLLVDSVTRVAMALRELGIAAGDPPAARGYTANAFSHIPRQVERCGAARAGGAITAVMSVLSETDDVDDPIVEMMKSILDGHIVLSRSLAERRHFPAIDIARSVSRLADTVSTSQQGAHAAAIYRLHATYEEARGMIESGIYASGANAEIDRAIAARQPIEQFLRQERGVNSTHAHTLQALQAIGALHGT